MYSSSDLNAVSFFIFLVCSEFGRKEDRVEIWIAKSVGWFLNISFNQCCILWLFN